jgi:hypothetical protein
MGHSFSSELLSSLLEVDGAGGLCGLVSKEDVRSVEGVVVVRGSSGGWDEDEVDVESL